MKIALSVALIVAAVIAIVVVIGVLLPKHHAATRSAFIKATPERIFKLISGPQDWRTDLRGYAVVDENGRHFLRETDNHGQTITYERVECSPPTVLKSRIVDKNLPFGGQWTWKIEEKNGGCLVTITEDGEVYNPVFRFVSRFVIGYTRTIDRYLARLAEVAQK